MPTDTLVLDLDAVMLMSGARFNDQWFETVQSPAERKDLRRVELGNTVYFLSSNATEASKLFICDISPGGIGNVNRDIAFQRAIRVVLATLGNSVGIPSAYRLHRKAQKFSVYAHPYHVSAARLNFRQENGCVFLYAFTEEAEDFSRIPIPEDKYTSARFNYEEALLKMWDEVPEGTFGSYGIEFNEQLGRQYGWLEMTIDEWCAQQLTSQQLRFVNAPLDKPIRLRGSPGTGKTQCMSIKCLKELFDSDDRGKPLRAAFITHSSGVAHEVVEGMMWALDPSNRRAELSEKLWLGSLYELAKEKLGYDKKQIVPLSLDGVDGRRTQEELLVDCVAECMSERTFLQLLEEASDYLRNGLEPPISPKFLRELANEIACSLDSEGIRASNREKVDEYLTQRRQLWQMNLDGEIDRRVVLEVHAKYSALLADTDTINLDQMISDLYGYLNSHEWSVSKRSQGFDVVFIDELHYFNRYERMIFHLLVRDQTGKAGRTPLFMAYDLKQATDDRALTSAGAAGRFFQTLHAGESDLVELTKVFRSTPEIARLLEMIDGAFPALDLEGEWNAYSGESQRENGDVPHLWRFQSKIQMLDEVVEEAHRYARQHGGKNVAVLCMSDRDFHRYSTAGRVRSKISVVDSNTDLAPIQYARQRCAFSMPESVAGLQFDRVYVLNVDKQELDDDEVGLGTQRQVLSRLYLAASRASMTLTLAASDDCGGPADVLSRPLDAGTLVEIGRD